MKEKRPSSKHTFRPLRWLCRECGWTGTDTELLRAPNPFNTADIICGCPRCRVVEEIARACDDPGCNREATCGTPTPGSYRMTCGEHYRKAENAHSDLLMAKEEAQKAQRVYRETARMKRAVRIKAARDAKVWVAEAQQIANSVEALAATWIDARRRSAKPEKNAFDVVLLKVADSTKKIAVIKVVRELTGLSLKDAFHLVDGAPHPVMKGVSMMDAEQMKAKLEMAGATIKLEPKKHGAGGRQDSVLRRKLQ